MNTLDYLTKAFDTIKNNIKNMLDLTKAFDTVFHKELLIKFSHYGIRVELAISCILTFQTDNNTLYINGFSSSLQKIQCSIPTKKLNPDAVYTYIHKWLCNIVYNSYTYINGFSSSLQKIQCGISQGSTSIY